MWTFNSAFISILKLSFPILDLMGSFSFCSQLCSQFLEKPQCLQGLSFEIAPEQAGLGGESSHQEKAEGGQALRLDQWWESLQSRGWGTSPEQKKFRNCSRGRRLHLRETLHR